MKNLILAATACAVSLGYANAAPLGVNLVVNGDAETQDMTGWISTGAEANPFDGSGGFFGTHSFTGGSGPATETMEQRIDLSGVASLIDNGTLEYNLSAQLQNRSFSGVFDTVVMSLEFLDAGDSSLNTPLEATDTSFPNAVYDWELAEIIGNVPVGARTAVLFFTFNRTGFSSTDAFADEISFVLGSGAAPVPVPAALPLFLAGLGGLIGRRRKAS